MGMAPCWAEASEGGMRNNLSVVARRSEPVDSLDYFPTPPWATRAMMAHMSGWICGDETIWEPACGEGHMAAVLAETNPTTPTDIFPYGFGDVFDFTSGEPQEGKFDWIITNPPFKLSSEFAELGIERARLGVILLVRVQWLASEKRYRLFSRHRPSHVLVGSCRIPMHKGRWVPDGSTATDYCWVAWVKDASSKSTIIDWIRPDAKRVFTKSDDAERFGAFAPSPLLEGRMS